MGALCCIEAAVQFRELGRLILYEPPLPTELELVPGDVRNQLDELVRRNRREEALALFFQKVVGVAEHELGALRAHEAWPGRVAAARTIPRSVESRRNTASTRAGFAPSRCPR